jgi:hypothetical protein
MATVTKRDYYKILVISASGAGKTYSLRNMDINSTGLINTENKPLPFPAKFVFHARPKKYAGALAALNDYIKEPKIKVVVLDSLSAMFDMLLAESRQNFSGWDIWNNYNKAVGELMNIIKNAEKEIIITGHYEILNIEESPEKRLKTKGKEWEGVIEKDFTMVLYPEIKYKNGRPERYIMRLAAEGTSAKCPPAIFGNEVYEVENDMKIIYDKTLAFAMQSATEVNTNAPVTEADIFN